MNAQVHHLADAREMREAEFERERERIRETYGDNNVEAGAQRDQALARLFYRSGWTQERLAAKEGCSRPYVTRKLLFGAFLNFVPIGTTPKNLTEGKFRGYWERTTGSNQRQRFAEVARLIEEDTRVGESTAKKSHIGVPLAEQFGDGKWHRLGTMVEHLDAPEADVLAVLHTMITRGTYNCHCEKKKVGKDWQYRILRGTGKRIEVALLMQELRPLIEGLKAEGQKNAATFSPVAVATLARQIELLIEKLAK